METLKKNFCASFVPFSHFSQKTKLKVQRRRSLAVTVQAEYRDENNWLHSGCGTHFFLPYAKQKALFEAWERYQLAQCFPLLLKRETFRAYQWLDFSSSSKKPCYLGTLNAIHSSNGFAAGPNIGFAARRAAAELFERHCVLSVWNYEYDPVRIKGLCSKFLALTHYRTKWKLFWFDLGRSDYWLTIACVAFHPRLGVRFDASASTSSACAQVQSYLGVLRQIEWSHFLNQEPDAATEKNWNQQTEPVSHLKYYAQPQHAKAFEYWISSKSKKFHHHQRFNPELLLLYCDSDQNAFVRAQGGAREKLLWGEESLSLCPRNPHLHPIV